MKFELFTKDKNVLEIINSIKYYNAFSRIAYITKNPLSPVDGVRQIEITPFLSYRTALAQVLKEKPDVIILDELNSKELVIDLINAANSNIIIYAGTDSPTPSIIPICLWQPKYSTSEALISLNKIHKGDNYFYFLENQKYPFLYKFTSDLAEQCPIVTNGKIKCIALSMERAEVVGEVTEDMIDKKELEKFNNFKKRK